MSEIQRSRSRRMKAEPCISILQAFLSPIFKLADSNPIHRTYLFQVLLHSFLHKYTHKSEIKNTYGALHSAFKMPVFSNFHIFNAWKAFNSKLSHQRILHSISGVAIPHPKEFNFHSPLFYSIYCYLHIFFFKVTFLQLIYPFNFPFFFPLSSILNFFSIQAFEMVIVSFQLLCL